MSPSAVRALLLPLGLFEIIPGLGCGGRSALLEPGQSADAGSADVVPVLDVQVEPPPECTRVEDCPGYEDLCLPVSCDLRTGSCIRLAPVQCSSTDPCFVSECVPETGKCQITPLSFDRDQDGFKGPRPGHAPGDPGSCGDDCNDTSDLAYPGRTEECDGVDNDCNGVVDDGAIFTTSPGGELRVTEDQVVPAEPTGLGWSGGADGSYLAAFTATVDGKTRVFTQLISSAGEKVREPEQLTNVNADAYGGTLVWTGDRYGVAWSDRRYGDYEVYFNVLDAFGAKLGPDARLTEESGFSINIDVGFNGTHFVVAWQDESLGGYGILGQLVDVDARPVAAQIPLSDQASNESPQVAVGDHTTAFVWLRSDDSAIQMLLTDSDLVAQTEVLDLTPPGYGGVYPTVVWNEDSYVVAWYDTERTPWTVYATVVNESGQQTVPPMPVANSTSHARYPALLALGDRVLLVYSSDHEDREGYELYARMLTADLGQLVSDVRLTQAAAHSIHPVVAFGPAGDVGILFRDDRLGAPHVFFTKLSCVASVR